MLRADGVLCEPQGLVFGPDGNLYVASGGNNLDGDTCGAIGSDAVLRYNLAGTLLGDFVPTGSGGLTDPITSCNASTVGTGTNVLAPGLAAWRTTLHALPVTPGTPATTYGATETRFTMASLSSAELARLTGLCGFIQTNGSGFGVCKSCRLGGLGGARQ